MELSLGLEALTHRVIGDLRIGIPMSERELLPEVQDYVQQVRRFVVDQILPHEIPLIRHSADPNCTAPHPLIDKFKVQLHFPYKLTVF